jgi:hypothetical protein
LECLAQYNPTHRNSHKCCLIATKGIPQESVALNTIFEIQQVQARQQNEPFGHGLRASPASRPISVSGVVQIGSFASGHGHQVPPGQGLSVWVGGASSGATHFAGRVRIGPLQTPVGHPFGLRNSEKEYHNGLKLNYHNNQVRAGRFGQFMATKSNNNAYKFMHHVHKSWLACSQTMPFLPGPKHSSRPS